MNTRLSIVSLYASLALTASVAVATPTLTTLVNFDGTNGSDPAYGSLIAGSSGNLYGTTEGGGLSIDGTVYGQYPYAGLIADGLGNLYGTTQQGGSSGAGTIFKLSGTGFVPVPEPTSLTLVSIGYLALLSTGGGACTRRKGPRDASVEAE